MKEILVIILGFCKVDGLCITGPCGPGQYLDGACKPCPPNTFSPYENHGCQDCERCSTSSQENHEVLLESCSPFKDAIIGCKPGYYRMTAHDGDDRECLKCTRCPTGTVILTKCGQHVNTFCASSKKSERDLRKPPVDLGVPVDFVMIIVICTGLVLYIGFKFCLLGSIISWTKDMKKNYNDNDRRRPTRRGEIII
ncbi:tumor necrosis factor receptor superfamily member 26 [Biomphalaria pfeifferi]|uniref:Tumor necrosis factor receptor superfamily member 26 n=1 Tax=Biomphalaria pfeifferi TaxID=112525 RepID=A0AAD8B0J6_BIOPF|nr:tumor necrosis factor receptor superfamily member 26 [Biomphalaria pfeifferi]